MLWDTFIAEGWTELIPIELLMFADVGLMADSSDRIVWRFVQENDMLLLTDNRKGSGKKYLSHRFPAINCRAIIGYPYGIKESCKDDT